MLEADWSADSSSSSRIMSQNVRECQIFIISSSPFLMVKWCQVHVKSPLELQQIEGPRQGTLSLVTTCQGMGAASGVEARGTWGGEVMLGYILLHFANIIYWHILYICIIYIYIIRNSILYTHDIIYRHVVLKLVFANRETWFLV